MTKFHMTTEQQGDVVIIRIDGYFEEETGEHLSWEMNRFFQTPVTAFILDFSTCESINSLGLAELLNLTLKVVDDRQGRVILTGVNQIMAEVMEIAGVHEFAEYAPDVPRALKLLKTTA